MRTPAERRGGARRAGDLALAKGRWTQQQRDELERELRTEEMRETLPVVVQRTESWHPSNPDLLMSRALGVCWHSPTSDRWPCTEATR